MNPFKKQIFAMLICYFAALSLQAQIGLQITGNISNLRSAKAMPYVTIALSRANDSSLVVTALADDQGRFVFTDLRPGKYYLSASAVGFQRQVSEILPLDSLHPQLITKLQMTPVDRSLAEVTVVSKKQFLERKLDKLVVNPEALITNAGSTAMEVLEKIPGVAVDKDGNISLKGKASVMVMLDGKPTYLGGTELANLLQTMSSSMVEQIEIMTNPSSKYDAGGNSGIINIKTKKNKQRGLNGGLNLAYSQGIYGRTNNSLNLNYRRGKVNLFSSVSANYRKSLQKLDIYRDFSDENNMVKAHFSQNTKQLRRNQNYNAKLGMDFYATNKTTFGILFTGYSTPSAESGTSSSFPRNNLQVLDSIVTAESINNGSWKNGAVNLNFQHNFDSTGRQLTFDVDYLRYNADNQQDFKNVIYNNDWSRRYNDRLVGDLPSITDIFSAKTDYTQLLPKKIKMDAGLKYSVVGTANTANYFNMVEDRKTIDISKTNRFTYRENVNAAYINLSKNYKKWGLQTGLRIENTNYEGHQFGNEFRPDADSIFTRSYTNAFPTTYISYAANEKNLYGVSYGRRIERPDYQDLNPFLYFLDKYTYEEGNPFLKPMYSNVLELTHTYRQFLTTTVNYSHTKDLIYEVFHQSAEAGDSISTVVTKGNIGRRDDVSVAVNAQVKVAKWWTMMVYAEGRYQVYRGTLYASPLEITGITGTANINNQFTFPGGWAAEASVFYRTKSPEGQIVIGAMSQADLGLKKDILKRKGSIKFAVRDVFGPMKVTGNINFQHTQAGFTQRRDSRTASLSFNYRFGKPLKIPQKRNTGGAADEQSRMKGNG